MKKISVVFLLNLAVFGWSQNTEKELINVTANAETKAKDTTNMGWKKGGNFNLLFNQTAFNNDWLGGGTSSMAANAIVNYDFNYKTPNFIWDNKIFVAYGLTKLKNQDVTKTDDRLEYTSLLGKKASGYWFYSGFFNLRTQMDVGLNADGNRISQAFSPLFIQAGPGMLWKKSDNLKVNIAPATSRLIYVNDKFTTLGPAFGVEQGETTRFEFGAALNGYYKFNAMENVSVENIVNLYSNYLDKPQNIDIDYQLNVAMKINKYLSTNFAFQAIYDDNAIGAFQIRQVFGLGFNMKF